MIPAYLSPLANHLWQSTLLAAAAGLLTIAFRKNRALVRYWLWLAASMKFLLPFSLLVSIGSRIHLRPAPGAAPLQFPALMDQISQPFAPPASPPDNSHSRETAALPPDAPHLRRPAHA